VIKTRLTLGKDINLDG